ncbi:MAG: sensor histidine kinase [Thermomicrobiales bacterium]|nr:sensor histidine kinase [Thermomicrobiales bacterium]
MGVVLTPRRLTRCGITDASAQEEEIYRVWYNRFLVIFAVIAAGLMIASLFVSGLTVLERAGVIGAIGFLVGWFWFFGKWNAITSDLHAVVYLAGNLIAICVAILLWDTTSMLLFAVYWLGFAYLYTAPAIVYALIVTVCTQVAFGTLHLFTDSRGSVVAGVLLLIVITGFSGLMAKYIESFQLESERNKQLLRQLQEAQASLAEREREAGIEQERHRVAGEIHDTIAQEFTSVITNLRAAILLEDLDREMARRHVVVSLEAANQGLKDSRAMLATMQPDVLEGRSLVEALAAIIDDERNLSSHQIEFQVEGTTASLDRAVETILVRSLQESLRNVRRHANATEVTVTLTWLEDEVLLDISDNGVGFDSDHLLPGADGYHIGLATMRARIESAGGTFVLESLPGEGTSVTVSFPTGGAL